MPAKRPDVEQARGETTVLIFQPKTQQFAPAHVTSGRQRREPRRNKA